MYFCGSRSPVRYSHSLLCLQVGAGSGGDGAMDAGNILKPMLARGELRCIGATTLKEYKQYLQQA